MSKSEKIKNEILEKVKKYYEQTQLEKKQSKFIPYAGRVYDEKELVNLVDSSLEFWLTSGRYTKEFEKKLCEFLDIKHCTFVNSGSSANLLAFFALTSPLLGDRQIKRGDEILTIAACFPTTISPIIQYGAIPVFIDVGLKSANIDVTQLQNALTLKTKAVFIAHTLGNPFDIRRIQSFCKQNELFLISDCCDSLGSKYKEISVEKFADISTISLFPAHHISTGQGGVVCTDNDLLHKIIKSMGEWGRQFKCNECTNDCKKRFDTDYDCRYLYSHIGFNLKATDMQAAIGCVQIEKLPKFIEKRKENWNKLYEGLKQFKDYFIFQEPLKEMEPSWFSFLITLKDGLNFTRKDLIQYLEKHHIMTRLLFSGNILKQPCFETLQENIDYKVIGNLTNTNKIMNSSFFIGVYPGIDNTHIDYMICVISMFLKNHKI